MVSPLSFLAKRLLFFGMGGGGLMAGVGPRDAQSNLSEWLELFGLPPLHGILTPAVDDYVFWGSIAFFTAWFLRKRATSFCRKRLTPWWERQRLVHLRSHDPGRGDLAATVIEKAALAAAVEAFNNCRYDTSPRRVDLAWRAMVRRLQTEGRTKETMEFLRGEELVNFAMAETPPEHSSVINQYHVAVAEFGSRSPGGQS